jgi:hypothetical protein
MIRFIALAGVLAVPAFTPYTMGAGADLSAESVTVGRNLQAPARITLGTPVPQDGLEVTLTSDDPSRLLLSKGEDQPGSATIALKLLPQSVRSPEFMLRALAASGSVSYTISAPGRESAKGAATLVPSAIVILGPLKAPRFSTTPRGDPSKLTIVSVALDPAGKILQDQPVAADSPLEVQIANSNPAAGNLQQATLRLAGGLRSASTYFHPAAEGDSTIAPVQPAGFATPADRASIVASVAKPALAIAGDIFLGKDLQTPATLVLGEKAPPGGVTVTLTSADSSRLVLSAKEDLLGSGSLKVTVPAGEQSALYFIQALGDSGDVAYSASAPGFRSKSGQVGLTASGFVLASESYGPPDEGNVKRKIGNHPDREVFVSLAGAKGRPEKFVVFSAYIDRESGRSADFTVEPLRAGVGAIVLLKSSNPDVATIESQVTIKPGFNRAICDLTPLREGKTVISLATPAGFSTPKNSTSVPTTVTQ